LLLSGVFQFSRGIQNGGAAPSILATWTTTANNTTLGHAFSAGATATRTFNLLPVGFNYGNYNLKQLDMKVSKRFKIDRYRARLDFDAYNLLNSNWPFTVTNTFSTASTSQYLRPTNVLQSRFYKVGVNFDF